MCSMSGGTPDLHCGAGALLTRWRLIFARLSLFGGKKLFEDDDTVLICIDFRELAGCRVRSIRCGFEFLQTDRSAFIKVECVELNSDSINSWRCMTEGGAHEGDGNGDGCREGFVIFHLVCWGCCLVFLGEIRRKIDHGGHGEHGGGVVTGKFSLSKSPLHMHLPLLFFLRALRVL